eukprot:GFUD01020500.1.p1 GENE.GFUD01020500.1~~GFUD01020500.1.p1  ORF type:complete len:337 (-),score=71.99 GFUD01020500.1:327-1337(-)
MRNISFCLLLVFSLRVSEAVPARVWIQTPNFYIRKCFGAEACKDFSLNRSAVKTYQTTKREKLRVIETPDNIIKRNEATLEICRLNWSLGDGAGITKLLSKNFTFTWLPKTDMEEIVDRDGFKPFFDAFKAKGAENGGPPLGSTEFMLFENIIQRPIGDTTFESAQWIVPGFADGTYMNAAWQNHIIWAMGGMSSNQTTGTNNLNSLAPVSNIIKRNEATLDVCRLNWSLGDGAGITKLLVENFTFTWLPGTDMEEIVDRDGFKPFFDAFKAKGAENGGPPLGSTEFMLFENIIQRPIGDTTFETAQWIVPGFADGTYMNAAKGNRIIWAMAGISA